MNNTVSGNASKISAPSISLPKGGGAIQGIGETFQPNSFSGTGSYSIPIQITAARGFEPQLALSYNSGGGNGIFGMGFNLGLPAISRRTEKGIPKYDDSDIFMLSGAELVPRLIKSQNEFLKDEKTENYEGGLWGVTTFSPRIEGSFDLIEQWVNVQTQESFWKITSRNNAVSVFGKTDLCRISDPANPNNIYEWLISESIDAKGNKIIYSYVQENYDNVSGQVYELHRFKEVDENILPANKYPSGIQYGNFIDEQGKEQFAFEIVFDYGERNLQDTTLEKKACNPYQSVNKWKCRSDPFSAYKTGFERRTYRLCRNILMFHHFKNELGNTPCMVRCTSFTYDNSGSLSAMRKVEVTGYRRKDDGSYEMQKMPPAEFEFSEFRPSKVSEFRMLESEGGSIPGSLDQSQFLPVDLYGEGLDGFLYSNDTTTFYLAPLGEGKYSAPQLQQKFPNDKNIQGGKVSLIDLDGNGELEVMVHASGSSSSGYYLRKDQTNWDNFNPFDAEPTQNPLSFEMVGLSGNGKTDLLLVEESDLLIYPSKGTEGYSASIRVPKEKDFPSVKKGYIEELVTFTNLLGDGLAHRVRITNGSVECWPSLGYGKFGAKIMMDNAPSFGEDFKASRLFLSDIDGSGTTDIIYVYNDRVEMYLNRNGNFFSNAVTINLPESYCDADQIRFADIMGNGTSCLIFSKMTEKPRHYYYEFTGQTLAEDGIIQQVMKPYLMISVKNNMGASTHLQYCSSTKFYLEDKKEGRPWITRLPFPVQVVEQVVSYDEVTNSRLIEKFKYHEGYYDAVEREFRGFGYVETWDTQSFEDYGKNNLNLDFPIERINEKLYVPPVYTRSWYHTGAGGEKFSISEQLKKYYYQGDEEAYDFPSSLFDQEIYDSDAETFRQAFVTLKGHVLRQEVYGLDGSEALVHPYTVSESNTVVKLLQGIDDQPYGIFMVHAGESISYQYERNPRDPRVQQEFVLEVDAFGNVTKSCSINLPRRNSTNELVYPEQREVKAIAHTSAYINNTKSFRMLGIPYETKQYEILGLNLNEKKYFSYIDLQDQVNVALKKEIAYGDTTASEVLLSRLIAWNKIFFWNELLTDVLPSAQIASKALVHHQEEAVFTKDNIDRVFNKKLTDEFIREEGGFYFDDHSNYWWNRGSVSYHYVDPACYYLPFRTENSFADPSSSLYVKTTVEYNTPYFFAPVKVSQWLDTSISNDTTAKIDYITLHPYQLTDLNNNISQVIFDPLGQVIVSSHFGVKNKKKAGGMNLYPETKSAAGYKKRNATSSGRAISFEDILKHPDYYLQGASAYNFYDLFAWQKNTGESLSPVCAVSLQRENFYYSPKITPFSCQTGIVYLDGFGRTLESKSKTDPGPGLARGADGKLMRDGNGQPVISESTERWMVSGRTVYNNKGKACQQYLPYFSTTPYYEEQVEIVDEKLVPPPSVIHYDPLLRVIRTDTPKGFFSKVEFTPWKEKHYDVNDTVLDSDYYKNNYSQKLNSDEKDALDKAAKFYNTPSVNVFDSMGHAFMQVQDNLGEVFNDSFTDILSGTGIKSEEIWTELVKNKYLIKSDTSTGAWLTENFQPYTYGFILELAEKFKTVQNSVVEFLRQGCLTSYHEHDIQGREVRSVDPRLYYSNVSLRTEYYNFKSLFPMISNSPLYHESADAGGEFHFTNIFGSLIWSLSPRNFNQLIAYDRLQRRVKVRVIGLKDDGTVATDNVVELFTYGESQTKAEDKNLKGQLYQLKDQSGIITHVQYDLNGTLLNTSRQFTLDYKNAVNWSQSVALKKDVYQTGHSYDALNRLLSQTTPDGNVTWYEYNQTGLVNTISVQDKKKQVQAIISDIGYNAYHQRTKVVYANGTQTSYTYEDTTHHLVLLHTTRTGKGSKDARRSDILQDIRYTYDPLGNITRMYDSSFETVFNNNQKIEPFSDYTYDALYKLVKANGRQHPGVLGSSFVNNTQNGDFKQSKYIPLANDSVKLENYRQLFTYDEAGNLIKTRHIASNSWTREIPVTESSNRLKTILPGNANAVTPNISYDRSGNQKQLELNSSVNLTWSCCENLVCASIIQRPGEADDADYYKYDSGEMRTRKVSERMSQKGAVTEAEEKVYLGNYEEKIFRTVTAKKETVTLRRQTLRVMDGATCVAIIHYWPQDTKKREVDKKDTRKIRYQLDNHLGSSAMELDGDANLISYEEYFPYGGTAFIAGNNQKEVALKEYRYSGKERDDSTGLYYYGARYYIPWLGRWLSPDPAGTVDGFNLYAFVGGNPINYHDPSGLTRTPIKATPDVAKASRTRIDKVLEKKLASRQSPRVAKRVADVAKLFDTPLGKIGHYYRGDEVEGFKKHDSDYVGEDQGAKKFGSYSALGVDIKNKLKEDLQANVQVQNLPLNIAKYALEAYNEKKTFDAPPVRHRVIMSAAKIDPRDGCGPKEGASNPHGGIDTTRDDRGHLVPEKGVSDMHSLEVNGPNNVIAENLVINQKYKTRFEEGVKDFASKNENLHVMTIHVPNYQSAKDDPAISLRQRPKEVTHFVAVNGVVVSAFTFKNSKHSIVPRG